MAPQVQAKPVGSLLRAELHSLKTAIETRSSSTNLEQAIEAALLNNPDLASAHAQFQGSQASCGSMRNKYLEPCNCKIKPKACASV